MNKLSIQYGRLYHILIILISSSIQKKIKKIHLSIFREIRPRGQITQTRRGTDELFGRRTGGDRQLDRQSRRQEGTMKCELYVESLTKQI